MDTREARIFTVVLIISVTLGTIIAYFVISIIRQQRRNLQMQKMSMLAEISAMEKERARIAADLHDELGPVLSVIQFQIDNLEGVKGEEKEQLIEASRHLDGLIARIREISNNLMPAALHRKGLIIAVEEFLSKAGGASGLKIRFEHPEQIWLTDDASVNIYLAIQEVVHNCIKHAGATDLEILMERKKGKLTILCRDNGKGFDYATMAKESTGIGLKSLKNRTEMMGGTLETESKADKGTAFLFEIPVE
jgi:signal transduction histidine kinase